MPFFISSKKLQAFQMQAFTQGQSQNILNLNLNELLKTSNWVNQYQTYEEQLKAIYQKYQGKSAYGCPQTADIIDKRTNLIISEGLSITAKRATTSKWIDKFISDNFLDGSRLIEMVRISEMEGRILTVIEIGMKKGERYIRVKNVKYEKAKYEIKVNPADDEIIEKIIINDSQGRPQPVTPDQFTYSHNGISLTDDPCPCIATILTNIEYIDRAMYDLRKSNHLFGFPTPNILTKDAAETLQVRNDLTNDKFKIGTTLIGPQMTFPQPPNSAEMLKGEISLHMKTVSSRTGIPVHWLGWTDLMSNRATAYELRDFISSSIRDEKIRAREHMRDIILKAMTMAYDAGIEGSVYDEDFEVDVPDVSAETVKQLSETWMPLYEGEVISKDDIQNKIPGINPLKTNKAIEREKQANMERFTKGITMPNEHPDEEQDDQINENGGDNAQNNSN